jgi:hypothetical protein
VRQLKSAKAIPYCHTYRLGGPFVPPADFRAGAYPGLIAWHVVADAGASRVISYWQDAQSHEYSHERFESALGLSAADGWEGLVGDLHAKEPQWAPTTIKEALIAISAALGAATVIWTTLVPLSETVWTTPNAELSFPVPNLDVTEGDSARVPVTARNAKDFVSVQLQASGELVSSNSAQPVQVDPNFYQTVEPGSAKTLTAIFKAPVLTLPGGPHPVASDYKLSMSGSMRTWRFQSPSTVRREDLPVRVWPRSFGWTMQLTQIAPKDSVVYNGWGKLYCGAAYPSGLRGTITIVAPVALSVDSGSINVLAPFQRLLSQPGASLPANGATTILMDFSSPPLEKNHEYLFQITITPGSDRPRSLAIKPTKGG